MSLSLRTITGAVLLISAGVLSSACGSDDDEKTASQAGGACFWQCSDDTTGCFSALGLPVTETDCNATAQDDCGGAPKQIAFQAGCSCPGDGDADECQSPPPWH